MLEQEGQGMSIHSSRVCSGWVGCMAMLKFEEGGVLVRIGLNYFGLEFVLWE